MSQTSWEADKMLDVYIYDYLVKRKLHGTAKAFQAEAKVSTDPVAIDAPGGFLFEWWSVFWDIFIARTNDRHSEAAASYIETQAMKARELQQQQQQPKQQQQQQQHQQQMQMQQLLMQRQAQQQQQQQQQQQPQRRDGTQILNGAASGLVGNDHFMRQNSANANAIAAKMYEEKSKHSLQRDPLDDAAMKQKMSDNAGQLLDPNHASMLKTAALGGQPTGQTLIGTSGGISGNLQQLQNRSQQLPVPIQDIKTEMNPMMTPRAAGSEGSLMGLHGPNNQSNVPSGSSQSGSSLPLKGYPLQGLDQLRPGFLQQKPMIQSPQAMNQLQFQQQLMLQAQHNFQPSSSNDELKRLRMLFNNRNMGLGKDGQINTVSDLVPNVGSPLQGPSGARPDAEMLMKLQQQQVQNNNQQYMQNTNPGQQPQSSNSHIQQDKMMSSGSLNVEGSMSNTFQGNDQGSKARKRKQPPGPANSTGTANTVGPSPSSPSTPSTHTPGDAMSMPENGVGSKSMLMYNSDNLNSMNSAQNHLTDIDRFVDDGALDDNIDSFLSHDEQDPQDRVIRCGDVGKGFTFKEIRLVTASTNKVECCNFSSDGKLLATGGHDKKAVLWCTESFSVKSTLEEHSQWITDVRFSPSMSRLATSSADKTVRIWDAENPGYSLRTFAGHSSIVTSLDFHPSKEDLVCSCDNNSEIRYWSIKNGGCTGLFRGGATQLRFQPRSGRLLAAAADNIVSILDVETQLCRHKLQGHKNQVHSVCWDPSGEYLATVSDDLVRVWTIGSGNKCEIVNELNCMGNRFNTCAFHPAFPSLLIIGCYETLELWNTSQNQTMTIRAHEKLVSSLAVSTASNLIASASHDKFVKIWK